MNDALKTRLVQGLSKLALAIRHNQQATVGPRGLTPTQGQILAVIAANAPRGLTVRWIADWLGVTSATVSDAVRVLQTKGLLEKTPAAHDRRSIQVVLTPAGRCEVDRIGLLPGVLLEAVDELEADEQAALLRLLVKLIRSLQRRGEIPVARMCATCQYFRPNVHDDPSAPHHCAFVDAAFGDARHMIDCPDHIPLPEAEQDAQWRRYLGRGGDDFPPTARKE